MSNLGDMLSKQVYSNVSQMGVWGEPPAAGGYGGLRAKPPAAGRFSQIFGKKSYFNPIGSHFARVHSLWKAGVPKQAGDGGCIPPIIWLYPPQ